MAYTPIITNENSVNRATLLQAILLNAKLRLVQNYQPQYTDNRAVLVSNEVNFAGYPSGGYNTTVWAGPSLPPGGGAVITPPAVQIAPNSTNTQTNNVTGGWVEVPTYNTGTNAVVNTTWLTFSLNPGIAVTVPTDQFPLIIQDWEGLVAAPAFG